MVGLGVASTAAATLAAAVAGGAPTPVPIRPPSGLSVAISRPVAGARPVTVTLAFPATLVCGRPTIPVSIAFPAGEHVPHTIAAAAVRVGAGVAGGVKVDGRTVVVRPPTQRGMMCHSITFGTEVVTFAPAAGLGNPSRAGRYEIAVVRRTERLRADFEIR